MKEYIGKLPRQLQETIAFIRDVSLRRATPAYLVGGIVRDMILGVDNFDLDIVVEGDAIGFASECSSHLGGRVVAHKRFGTATVALKHGVKIDFATARKERYPVPGDLPSVCPGGLGDDLARRDFSINAMALTLSGEHPGTLVDCFNGARDLKEGKIRVLHDRSFLDDPTRMLRAVRFEQRYGFTIEAHTRELLAEAVKRGVLEKVQPQRVRDELILIMQEPDPVKPLRRIHRLMGFGFIDKGFAFPRTAQAFLASARRQIKWFQETHVSRRSPEAWVIYLIALLDPARAEEAEKICAKFAFHRGVRKRVLDYKKINRAYILKLSRKDCKGSQLFKLLEPLSYEAIVCLKAKYKNADVQRNIQRFLAQYSGTRLHVNGDDLRHLGVRPGPGYQRILAKVLNAKLDGLLAGREEELAFVKGIVKAK